MAATAAGERKKRTSRGTRSFATRAMTVMRVGESLKGVPYRYGGATPRGFDCSGFTSYVYRKAGVTLPRRASIQRAAARRISRSNARPGDLVFFHDSRGRVYHVGIYAGANRTLHSGRPGTRVRTEPIWTRRVTFGRAL
jgi:cell wall-associated NlpC family hydrolase